MTPRIQETATNKDQPTLAKALLLARCPSCRQGRIFTEPWNHLRFLEIHFECPVCKANLMPEPGFYTGSMYVNYAFNIAQLTIVGLFTWLVFDPASPWVIIGAVLGITFLTIPFTARISRVIWLHLFGGLRYNGSGSPSPRDENITPGGNRNVH
ncbi:MAG: hypothetical protein RLZZ165_853 [Bacteroidota bacterium]|jgi:uncharacterized protein (DUF983 family)